MNSKSNEIHLLQTLRRLPQAVAVMRGSPAYGSIRGTVRFYQAADGTLVVAELEGLPVPTGACENGVFGFHIHGGSVCAGDNVDPFANAGSHYNPNGCPHPYHAGDLPPLFNAGGRAFLAVLTHRFTVNEVIGKTVILHDRPDDFTTQPSGNVGDRIACGVISRVRR